MSDILRQDYNDHLDHYAVMGNPVAHSKSPIIHRLFAEQTQQNIQYDAIFVEENNFIGAVESFRQSGGKGLNITLPFKQLAWEWVKERSPTAIIAGAVNTIIFRDNHTYGDNTDGIGLIRDLMDNHHIELQGQRILLLGAGGAAHGVMLPLLQQRPMQLHIANRTLEKAEQLARAFAAYVCVTHSSLSQIPQQTFDVIINATSASLFNALPEIPHDIFSHTHCCYDMAYGDQPTIFLQTAKKLGVAQCIDGLGMLVEQAAESFYLWRGIRPNTQPVITHLRSM